MSGRRSKRKGYEAEREFAKLVRGRRVPLSGAQDGYANDVVLPNGWRFEVKRRKDGFKQLYDWLNQSNPDGLAIRADRKPWLIILPIDRFMSIIHKLEEVEDEFIELASEVWIQWGLDFEDGRRDSGGLSLLEWIEMILRKYGKIDENGRFEWERSKSDDSQPS